MKSQIENAIIKVFEKNVSPQAKAAFLEVAYALIRDNMTEQTEFSSYGGWSNDLNPYIQELGDAGIFHVHSPDKNGQIATRVIG